MRILFVQPGGSGLPHLGVMYLSAALKRENYPEIKFCSIQDQPLSDKRSYNYYLSLLKTWKPDVVGVSYTAPDEPDAIKICNNAKESNTFVIVGGPGPSCSPDAILHENKCIDAVIYGEADNTIAKIIGRIEDKKGLQNITGVIWRRGKRIIKNKPTPLISNLNDLPFPDHSILDFPTYHTPFAILTSRGCPHKCVFCFKPVHGSIWRSRSPANVVDEIESLTKNYSARLKKINYRISVTDDAFNLDLHRAKAICDEILQRGIKIRLTFVNGFHVGSVDRELFDKLKNAGAIEIWFGIESGSVKVLPYLKKGISIDMVRTAVRLAREAGIQKIGGHFIIGLPNDTSETVRESIGFAKSLDLNTAGFTHANVLPGTELETWVSKNGTYLQSNISKHRQLSTTPIFETHEFSAKERISAYEDSIRYVNQLKKQQIFNLMFIKKWFGEIKSLSDLNWLMRNGIDFLLSSNLRTRKIMLKPSIKT